MAKASCPKLERLSLVLGCLLYEGEFSSHSIKSNHDEHEIVRFGLRNNLQVPLFDLRIFRNLKTLDLLNIYGNLQVQARNLGTVFAEKLHLRELSLSIQPSAIPQEVKDALDNIDP